MQGSLTGWQPRGQDVGSQWLAPNLQSQHDGLLPCMQESLKDLNTKLEEQIKMNRFRPNIVVSGAAPALETGHFLLSFPCTGSGLSSTVILATGHAEAGTVLYPYPSPYVSSPFFRQFLRLT